MADNPTSDNGKADDLDVHVSSKRYSDCPLLPFPSNVENSLLSKRALRGLSMSLSRILRHDAVKLKLHISADGRVLVDELLHHLNRSNNTAIYTFDHVAQVVRDNDKKRFELTDVNGAFMIRAVQGHTMSRVIDEELLQPITKSSDIPVCIHGTYKAAISSIISHGLSRMKRNHIHFSAGELNDGRVISGMRRSSEVLIYIDVSKAMSAGITFFRSLNNVILTRGLCDSGTVPVEFFLKIVYVTL